MFTKAIVRTPCTSLEKGITNANLGIPDYEKAVLQHQEYIQALKKCGLEVIVLEALEDFPDSVFVEDTAVLTGKAAIICNPGAPSRNAEIKFMEQELTALFPETEKICFPGTLDGGDVMQVENHFYIGLSGRTNQEGAVQFISYLEGLGYSGSTVPLGKILHLKTGINYLGGKHVICTDEFMQYEQFESFNTILVPGEESYAANSLWINDHVLVPNGFPKTEQLLQKAGFHTIAVNVSEFQKLDGGLSCLSLRF